MTDAVREYREIIAAIAELEAKLHTLGHDYDALRDLLEAVENARNDCSEACREGRGRGAAVGMAGEGGISWSSHPRRTPSGHAPRPLRGGAAMSSVIGLVIVALLVWIVWRATR